MKIVLPILIFYLIAIIAHAQESPPKIQWHRTYGSGMYARANSITNSSNGGFVLAGNIKSNAATHWTNNAKIVKIDDLGRVIWEKTFGYDNKDDWAISIIKTNGGYVAAGFCGLSKKNDRDGWVVKLDEKGGVLWEKIFGDSKHDWINSIIETPDGGFLLTGVKNQVTAGVKWFTASWSDEGDVWVIKLNKNGDLEWEKTFGDAKFDWANSAINANDGGYMIVGYTESYGEGGQDIWILKLNKYGLIVWKKCYGNHLNQIANSIVSAVDGKGYVVAGVQNYEGSAWVYNVTPFLNSSDWWIFQIDENGNIIWEENFGDECVDFPNSIIQTADGNYIIAGFKFSIENDDRDIWLMKISPKGKQIWETKWALPYSHDWANCIIQTPDGGYAVAGYTKLMKKESDMLILKFK